MKYKAIIFDMDGTIIDSERVWHIATEKMLKKRNIELSEHDLQMLFKEIAGAGLPHSCSLLKHNFGLSETVQEIELEKSVLATNLYKQQAAFIDGFTTFHENILKLQIKTALATNADTRFTDMINEKLNLTRFFGEHIYTISHVNNIGKPDPTIYLHTADKIEIKPEHCIAIEDSAHGIKAAKDAGMFCIGINTSRKREQVQHADLIIDAYGEINLTELLKR